MSTIKALSAAAAILVLAACASPGTPNATARNAAGAASMACGTAAGLVPIPGVNILLAYAASKACAKAAWSENYMHTSLALEERAFWRVWWGAGKGCSQ